MDGNDDFFEIENTEAPEFTVLDSGNYIVLESLEKWEDEEMVDPIGHLFMKPRSTERISNAWRWMRRGSVFRNNFTDRPIIQLESFNDAREQGDKPNSFGWIYWIMHHFGDSRKGPRGMEHDSEEGREFALGVSEACRGSKLTGDYFRSAHGEMVQSR